MPKISLIGAGNVGSTIAHSIIQKQLTDIILLDIDSELAKGKAMDLEDFQSLINGNLKIQGTDDYSLIQNSEVIVISAGLARKKGTEITREDLFKKNSEIITEIAKKIKKYSPKSIIITVTNPVDKMNELIFKEIPGDRKKIIGAGNLLDTVRLKTIISKELKIPCSQIQTIVKGPHNDNMIPVFSNTNINGKSILDIFSEKELQQISKNLKLRGKSIVDLMGSGYYAIGNVVSHMIEAILLDTKQTIPASVYLDGEYGIKGTSLGVLVSLGKKGAEIIEKDFKEKKELLEFSYKTEFI